MSDPRTVEFIGGPFDGKRRTVEGTVIKVEEQPVVPLVMEGGPIPDDIMLKNGTYISDPADDRYMRWNGWA